MLVFTKRMFWIVCAIYYIPCKWSKRVFSFQFFNFLLHFTFLIMFRVPTWFLKSENSYFDPDFTASASAILQVRVSVRGSQSMASLLGQQGDTIWEPVRHANSWAPLQTHWVRNSEGKEGPRNLCCNLCFLQVMLMRAIAWEPLL